LHTLLWFGAGFSTSDAVKLLLLVLSFPFYNFSKKNAYFVFRRFLGFSGYGLVLDMCLSSRLPGVEEEMTG
jgi:hypothetical protein